MKTKDNLQVNNSNRVNYLRKTGLEVENCSESLNRKSHLTKQA